LAAASEVIDWSLPCPSIFSRRRPLAEATLRRIAAGLERYVLKSPAPFIVRHGHYSTITGAGLVEGCGAGTFRGQPLDQPLATVCATNDKHLVVPFVTKHYGGMVGHDARKTLGTITARDHHALSAAMLAPAGDRREDVRAFLVKYYGSPTSQQQSLFDPLHTVTSKARFGLVMVQGEPHEIVDIGMRMLAPHELFAAQGFPSTYRIEPSVGGKPLTKTAQIRCAGNSVCPPVAEAIVAANLAGVANEEQEAA
jgi:DNA (cytosine-5)-methyltransferase 1